MTAAIREVLTPVLISAVLSMECGTGYSPREPGRLNFVLAVGGEEALEKYGKQERVQGFPGDLVEAVAGNPAAEEHARTYRGPTCGCPPRGSAREQAGDWSGFCAAIGPEPHRTCRDR